MKTHNGYISNSSSTSFIIINKTNKNLSIVDFVKENPQLVEEFANEYDYDEADYNQEKLIVSAQENNFEIAPGSNLCTFGDEDGTLIGHVFDYILRSGGRSTSFEWHFDSYNR